MHTSCGHSAICWRQTAGQLATEADGLPNASSWITMRWRPPPVCFLCPIRCGLRVAAGVPCVCQSSPDLCVDVQKGQAPISIPHQLPLSEIAIENGWGQWERDAMPVAPQNRSFFSLQVPACAQSLHCVCTLVRPSSVHLFAHKSRLRSQPTMVVPSHYYKGGVRRAGGVGTKLSDVAAIMAVGGVN